MKMIKHLILGVSLSLTSLLSAAEKPNILVILLDDMCYNALGYTGSEVIKTPNLDSICKQGVFFPQGYVTHGVCAPSRAGLMTGRYQARFGYETLSGGIAHATEIEHGMDTNEITIAQLLKPAGYKSAAIGKWHLGEVKRFLPLQRGFDYNMKAVGYPTFKDAKKNYLLINEEKQPWPEDAYRTDLHTDYAIKWLKETAPKNPFFLYYSLNAMHTPIVAPIGKENYGIHPYVGMMENVDQNVGRLLSTLDELGERENTIIFFLNDNGGITLQKGIKAKDLPKIQAAINNGPYKANKASLEEGGVRVPFAIHWPGKIGSKEDFAGPIISLDIFPTIAAAAGVALPADREIDGINLLPYLTGKKAPLTDRQFLWRWGRGHAVRQGDWKLVWPVDKSVYAAALKREGITPIKSNRPNPDRRFYAAPQLYNLADDPSETTDLAAKFPEVLERMKQESVKFDAIAKPYTEGEMSTWPKKP
ncbi:sulfatase-like hydrolase/transferase [Persicirhabdus sediminis]|uniref:Sulfatase-like hydrolase/transferase n=1 Tax=Persicirhabdus sediminis TaxID=454144 RepID=A0A8J7MCS4_9BACT|nr:sulfatase-like hydrolase/transferase [Persicirhabdus sediminis]MBK1790937.1 sulfatase-like hydrolase/transferase [Persicirhabdus sediminis]